MALGGTLAAACECMYVCKVRSFNVIVRKYECFCTFAKLHYKVHCTCAFNCALIRQSPPRPAVKKKTIPGGKVDSSTRPQAAVY